MDYNAAILRGLHRNQHCWVPRAPAPRPVRQAPAPVAPLSATEWAVLSSALRTTPAGVAAALRERAHDTGFDFDVLAREHLAMAVHGLDIDTGWSFREAVEI